MHELFNFLLSQAQYAHFYIFGLFMLAGFNLPVSEDILIIAGAIISVKYAPENSEILFAACFAGAYLSDIVCYFLGKKFGPKLVNIPPFSKLIDQDKISTMNGFYDRYGSLTLFVGRFIPFGVRNAIFLTAGMSKMKPLKFAVIDFAACSITTVILFSLGRLFAENYEKLFSYLNDSKWIIAGIAVIAVSTIVVIKRSSRHAT